ncbi:hypothetical protein CCY99_01460 [Helicobacter sp. 16-1353]|uniref:DUF3240 family protein n=1 Tax=Helicobacter sp. 16-1353 TaxID=2004996 RepID=UPI000DCD33A6|nr:DUF3240 family protein [Helicobacter sp. 16-1353]RAX54848.1 hypothetical protein CCY99_01460 [Helicobacter sp. 16-1353]
MNVMQIYFRDNFKDMVVDCLLESEFDNFYYFDCKQYNTKNLTSAKERVTGRIDYGKIELLVESREKEQLERLANKLYAMFGKEDLRIYLGDLKAK